MATDIISYGYAAIVFFGGVMGYVKAGSTMSLAMGGLFSSIIAFGAYRMSQNPKDYLVSLIVSGGLFALMGYRFYNSGKMMPAGLTAGLSLLQVIRLVVFYVLA